jgi:hypothetical protein
MPAGYCPTARPTSSISDIFLQDGPTLMDWNVAKGTLIELVVNPNPSFVLQELHLDHGRYKRHEIFPYPEIDNPPKVWNYIDSRNGIVIRTQSSRGGGGEELVVSITYQPSAKDEHLRCPKGGKTAGNKP